MIVAVTARPARQWGKINIWCRGALSVDGGEGRNWRKTSGHGR